MILCMVVAVSLVSVIHTTKTLDINKEGSRQIVKLICDNNAKALDAQLVAIERSVDLLTQHISFFLYDNKLPLQKRIKNLERISLSTADYTSEAYSVYFHCNPEKYDSSMDFFYFRNHDTGKFEAGSVANPYTYEQETGLSAGWYFESACTKKACWLAPYVHTYNEDGKGVIVASYTVPLFDESQDLLGVMGMDYTFDQLFLEVNHIKLYDTGYAFLVTKDGTVITHPEIPFGTNMSQVEKNLESVKNLMEKGKAPEELFRYHFHGEEKQMTYSALRNGIYLVVTAPTKEINASVQRMVAESQILFVVVMISSVMVVYCIVYKFIHPLQLLTYASQQIIKGNMKVELPYKASDEIGELTDNFRKMAFFLQDQISRINTMAYTDAMTGLKNKASYQGAIRLLQERISQGFSDFGVVVFDLNNLKRINDSLGHVAGDQLIKNAGKAIGEAFSHSPVFRIGGDEFVVLLENDDLQNFQGCIEELGRINRNLNESLKGEEQISIAYGMARFDKGQDSSYCDVFSRADKEMYRHKQSAKKKESPNPKGI